MTSATLTMRVSGGVTVLGQTGPIDGFNPSFASGNMESGTIIVQGIRG